MTTFNLVIAILFGKRTRLSAEMFPSASGETWSPAASQDHRFIL